MLFPFLLLDVKPALATKITGILGVETLLWQTGNDYLKRVTKVGVYALGVSREYLTLLLLAANGITEIIT